MCWSSISITLCNVVVISAPATQSTVIVFCRGSAKLRFACIVPLHCWLVTRETPSLLRSTLRNRVIGAAIGDDDAAHAAFERFLRAPTPCASSALRPFQGTGQSRDSTRATKAALVGEATVQAAHVAEDDQFSAPSAPAIAALAGRHPVQQAVGAGCQGRHDWHRAGIGALNSACRVDALNRAAVFVADHADAPIHDGTNGGFALTAQHDARDVHALGVVAARLQTLDQLRVDALGRLDKDSRVCGSCSASCGRWAR